MWWEVIGNDDSFKGKKGKIIVKYVIFINNNKIVFVF